MYVKKVAREPSKLDRKLEQFDIRSISITTRIVGAILLIGVLIFLATLIYSQNIRRQLLADNIESRKNFLHNEVRFRVQKKMDISLTNGIGFASNRELQEALAERDRKLAQQTLRSIGQQYRENSQFNNIKIHIHTPALKSFLRSWDHQYSGDEAGPTRFGLREVASSRKSWAGFELSKDGLAIRGIVPVIRENELIGVVEFLQGMASTAKEFEDEGRFYLILLKQDAIKSAGYTSNNTKIWDFEVANDLWFTDKTIEFARKIDYQKLQDQGYIFMDHRFITFLPLTDFRGNVIGIQVVGETDDFIFSPVDRLRRISSFYLFLLTFFIAGICLFLVVALRRLIVKPVLNLQAGMEHFFGFLQGIHADIRPVILNRQDEMGSIAGTVNRVMEEARTIILEYRQVLENSPDGNLSADDLAELRERLDTLAGKAREAAAEDTDALELLTEIATTCEELVLRIGVEEQADNPREAEEQENS